MKHTTFIAELGEFDQPAGSRPFRANLPGPSRRIVVEPIEAPPPVGVPAEPPAEPARRRGDEAVPAP